MALYALKNATDPKNKDAILAAISTMKIDTIVGPIDFTAPIIAATGTGPADWPAGPGPQDQERVRPRSGRRAVAHAGWQVQVRVEVPVDKTCAPYMQDSTLKAIKPLPVA